MKNVVYRNKARGGMVIFALVFGTIGVIVIGGLVDWSILSNRLSNSKYNSERAFQIAEAGATYYRWHLAHAPTDYQDGTGVAGPYLHEFRDKDNTLIGYYSLEITPPPDGSTMVIVTSTGYTTTNPNQKRIIRAQYAIPSLARYAVAANDNMRFGSGTTIYGPVHSNGGIRFDGVAENLVTSSKSKYDDLDHTGGDEFGVHTHVSPTDPLPPSTVPSRTDIFKSGRLFPVPSIDFAGMSGDLSNIKADAQANGQYFANSGVLGYRIVLKNNDTFDIYEINKLQNNPHNCANTLNQKNWGTWSISTSANSETLLGNYPNPANGVIFVEDNVWVEGQIASTRLTIASAKFPENPNTNTNITINNDLKYTTYDSQEIIALMAQNNINVGLYSDNDLQIDAALLAKNGRAGRYYYSSNCGAEYIRSKLTLNGMIGTNQRYGFAYTDNTGYTTRNINYDINLLYTPPPSFPLSGNQYSLIDWQEVK